MTREEFRSWRESQGLTTAEAAELLSREIGNPDAPKGTYSAQRIRDFENGHRKIPHVVALYVRTQKGKTDDSSRA